MKATIHECTPLRDLFMILKKNASREKKQILQNVRLIAGDDSISFVYTDGDVTKRLVVDGEIEEPGQVIFDLRDFDKIAKKLKKRGGPLTFEREESDWVSVSHADLDFRLVGYHEDDQFDIPEIPADDPTVLNAGRVFRAFESCSIAISSDQKRPNLTGLYLTDDLAVATDGHRLRKVKIGGAADFGDVIVPGDAIEAIVYAMKKLKIDDDAETGYMRDGDLVHFAFEGCAITTKIIEGSFPDFTQVIPKSDPDRCALVDRKEFLTGLDLIDPFVSSKTSNVRVTLNDEGIELYASDPNMGEGKTSVACEYTGPPVKAGYNIKYVKAALKDIDTDAFHLEMIDSLSPTMITTDEEPDDLWVVMPMRL